MIYIQEISSIASNVAVTAHHFKVLDISVRAKAKFSGAGWSLRTDIRPGLTLDFSNYLTPCTHIELKSETGQTIEFWAGLSKAEDSSLSGTIGVGAGKRIVYNNPITVTNSTAVEIFPQDLQRKLGTFSINGSVFVNDINGVQLDAGLHVWENGQPMQLIAESTDVVVRSLDEGY